MCFRHASRPIRVPWLILRWPVLSTGDGLVPFTFASRHSRECSGGPTKSGRGRHGCYRSSVEIRSGPDRARSDCDAILTTGTTGTGFSSQARRSSDSFCRPFQPSAINKHGSPPLDRFRSDSILDKTLVDRDLSPECIAAIRHRSLSPRRGRCEKVAR